jgi:hypothetical protein
MHAHRKDTYYASIAKNQLVEFRKQTKQLDRQARLDERPWLQMQGGESFAQPVAGGNVNIVITISNAGKTAAREVHGIARVEKLRTDQAPSLRISGSVSDTSAGILFPGQPLKFAAPLLGDETGQQKPVPVQLTAEDVGDWNGGKIYLAVFGQVTYRDVFDVDHWTNYCTIYLPRGPGPSMETNSRSCAAANNVDNNSDPQEAKRQQRDDRQQN